MEARVKQPYFPMVRDHRRDARSELSLLRAWPDPVMPEASQLAQGVLQALSLFFRVSAHAVVIGFILH